MIPVHNRVGHLLSDATPKPRCAFSDVDAGMLCYSYRRDPSNVACPMCGPGGIEVLAFIEPVLDANGTAAVTQPDGSRPYAVAVFCHHCNRVVGIQPN